MREGLPQVLSPDVLVLALKFMELSHRPDFRLGFNSLGGCVLTRDLRPALPASARPDVPASHTFTRRGARRFASVNHLHFQLLVLRDLFQVPAFPCEAAPRVHLWDCRPPPDDDTEEALAAAASSAVCTPSYPCSCGATWW